MYPTIQACSRLCFSASEEEVSTGREISWHLCPVIEDFSRLVKEVERGNEMLWKSQGGERSSGSL